MKRLIAGMALATLTLGAAEAYAIDVDLACPTSVKVGASLNVTVYMKNWNSEPVTVNRGMTYLAGNSNSSTVASVGLWGPFYRNGFGSKTVSGAASDPITYEWTPGTLPGFNVWVMSPVPASLSGTMAFAGFEFLDSAGRGVGGGVCNVLVVP